MLRSRTLVITGPKGLKSLVMVWSARMFRSTRNSTLPTFPAFHSRQMIWKTVKVFPVPVAMTSSTRRRPRATASTARWMAARW